MLGDVSATFALAEQMEEAFSQDGAAALESSGVAGRILAESQMAMASEAAVTDGQLTVQVHSEGPLKTMLTTKRTPPGQRHTESVFAA
jgi:redox-regulated HSP33 family molecular chaperone